MPDIVVIGSINMDLVVKTQAIPAPGETVNGEDLRLIPGGKGANQAVAVSRLGVSVDMVGRVGRDAFGETLIAELETQGVGIGHIRRDSDSASGTALIVVDARGENCIVVSPGANGQVAPSDVDQVERLLAEAKILLLQLEIPLDTVAYAIQLALKHGVKTILNPAPARDLLPAMYAGVEILVPNETELAAMTGVRLDNLESIETAAKMLLERGPRAVVVTLGGKGAYLASEDESIYLPAFAAQAVDTTAAGDAFIGGLAVAWMRTGNLRQAGRYANACGALATTRFGAQPSLPNIQEVERFLAADP